MNNAPRSAPIYVLGSSEEERQRLIAQSSIYGQFTEKLLVTAGIASGMHVLDIGCGVGDVSLLAARLVGPTGSVVGVDRNAVSVSAAQDRARSLDLSHVAFVTGDPTELSFRRPFDALIGRFVLMYQADPQAMLGNLLGKVAPDAVLAFHELDFTDPPGLVENPAWRQCFHWWKETARRGGVEVHMGMKLYTTFAGLGLRTPQLEMFTPLAVGPDSAGYSYVAESVHSILPLMESLGVASPQEVEMPTLADRLKDGALHSGGVLVLPHTVGAWARRG